MKEMVKIQAELKAPKGQYNKFGKYKYRNAEDILEAVKPHLKDNNCILTLTDEIVLVGERYYVKATARLINESGEFTEVNAYARESENKKGMDDSQITGAASSYARKYALNGLFAIDDTKDADSMDNVTKAVTKSNEFDVEGFKNWLNSNDNKMPSTDKQHKLFNIELGKITEAEEKQKLYKWLGISSSKELTSGKIDNLIKWLQKKNRSQDLKKIIGD